MTGNSLTIPHSCANLFYRPDIDIDKSSDEESTLPEILQRSSVGLEESRAERNRWNAEENGF